MKEIWKDSYIYGDIYSVSNFGKVKNKFTNHIKVPNLSGKGYARVMLKKKGFKSVFVRVHRLVAEAFIPNQNKHPEVNHKNGVKTDNAVWNLEWCTGEQNIEHAIKNKLFSDCSLPKKVIDKETGFVYSSIREAEKATGCVHISRSANKSGLKCRWRFV